MNYIEISRLNQLKNNYDIFFEEKISLSREMLLAGHHLPLLINQTQLLWGATILRAALEWDVPGLWVRVSEAKSLRDIMEEVLLCENRSGRYSWEEVDRIFELSQEPRDEAFMKLVFGQKWQNQQENLAFYRNAPSHLATLINQKSIDFKLAENLMTLDQASQDFLLENQLFIGLSFSQKRIFFQHFQESCERDQLSSETAFSRLENLFSGQDPLADLYKWRYPQLSRMESQFQDFIDKHLKKSGVILKAPPYFEGKDYFVEFSFSTPKNLNRRIQALKDLEDHAHELFELL